MRRIALSLLVIFLLAGCVGVQQFVGSPPTPSLAESHFQIDTTTERDRVKITLEGEQARFDVYSDTGIGSAEIRLVSGRWPGVILLRLHLQGLEDFRFTYGATSVQTAVSSGPGRLVRETVTAGESGKIEQPITPGDAEWMEISFGEGYFDVQAPASFFTGAHNAFTFRWVDFFR